MRPMSRSRSVSPSTSEPAGEGRRRAAGRLLLVLSLLLLALVLPGPGPFSGISNAYGLGESPEASPGGGALVVVDLFFHYDDDYLTPYDRALLKEILPFLKTHPAVHVLLYAHADIRGTKEYNYALARSRGTSVKDFLVVRGIDPSRIAVIPLGVDPIPHLPLCREKNEPCYHLHRIVHLVEYIPPPKIVPPPVRRPTPPPPGRLNCGRT